MTWARSFLDTGERFLEHFFADGAHFAEDVFEESMVGDGFFIKERLVGRERQTDGLGLDLSGEPPGMGRLGADTALSHPSELLELRLERAIALLELTNFGR